VIDQLTLVEARDLGEQVEPDAPTEHGGGLQHPLGAAVELVDLGAEQFGEVPRQGPGGQIVEVVGVDAQEELLEVEGVAAGAGPNGGGPARPR